MAAEITLACLRARRELGRAPLGRALERLRSRPRRPPSPRELEQARRLARATVRTLAHVPGDTRCLTCSLALTRVLARRGIDSRLVLGTRTEPPFLAHAWVECAGVPVLDPGAGSFERLAEL